MSGTPLPSEEIKLMPSLGERPRKAGSDEELNHTEARKGLLGRVDKSWANCVGWAIAAGS